MAEVTKINLKGTVLDVRDANAARASDLAAKQDVLVSGTNIKTINGQSLLGSGDITIASGKSAYEVAVDEGYSGTEASWVASLKGEKGDKGDTGNVQVDGDGNVLIVNNLEDGGTGAGFSAEMGKRVAGREATDRQRIDAIVAILKKSVFTDDQTASFAALDELANATDSISLDKTSYLFNGVGGTMTLTAYTDPSGKSVTWSSNNTSVVTVSNGVVTAIAEGTATITATSGGKTAACVVQVQAFQVDSVTLNKSSITSSGDTVGTTEQLTATTSPAGGSIVWSSSDTAVATVDNTGLVTFVGNGTCTITATSGTVSASCSVTVSGIKQVFSVSKSLSNVTIDSPNTNIESVVEGTHLVLEFTASSSHVIENTSTVTMGGVAQTLNIAQDGLTASCEIASVSGDIAIVMSAEYVPTNLFTTQTKNAGRGIIYNTNGHYESHGNYDCHIVPVEFGKQYTISGYRWHAAGGTGGGFNIALLKGNGSGGYTNLLGNLTTAESPGDFISKTAFNSIKGALKISTYVYRESTTIAAHLWTTESFTIGVPLAEELNNIEQVYFAINTRFNTVDVSSSMTMYEKAE